MQRTPSFSAVVVLIALLLFQGLAPDLQAQAPPPPTPQQLDQLLAPIALYPDSLLAQITTASTNPQEILDFDNWLAQNGNLTLTQKTAAAEQSGFDPAFIALAGFPDVVQMMADNIDDYAAIGSAVQSNQDEVSASIQRLRSQAYNAGSLRSTAQQQVVVQSGPYYVIQPVNPQVVYVPQYDPTVVYAGSGLNVGLITFGIGIGITALLVSQPWGWGGWGWNWGSRRIYYNRGPWGGWNGGYRPPRPWYRPRPVYYNQRPGFGGNWGYRPPNYRPPRPVNRPVYNRPGTRPPGNGGRPVIQPVRPGPGGPGNGRPVGGPRPPSNGGRPSIQPVRPGGPGNSRPVGGPRPPSNGGQPSIQPVRPGGPGNSRPTPQPRPTNARPPAQTRPAPQPRPQVQRPAVAPRPQTRPQGQARPQQRPQGGNDQRGPR